MPTTFIKRFFIHKKVKIQTSNCIIRSFKDSDAKSIAKYADNIHIWNNVRDLFPYPYKLEDAQKFIDFSLSQDPVCNFAIEVNGEAIGVIGLILGTDINRISAELGYWIGEPYWGKGIMTEAVKAFIEYSFQTYKIHRIFAGIFSFNPTSMKVVEKAGLKYECTLKEAVIKNGEICDEVIYTILKTNKLIE